MALYRYFPRLATTICRYFTRYLPRFLRGLCILLIELTLQLLFFLLLLCQLPGIFLI